MADDERWPRAKQLLSDFLDATPDDRTRWLDERCGEDAALRAEVESLIAAHDYGPLSGDAEAVNWLGEEGAPDAARSPSPTRPEAGGHLGGYQLLEESGGGTRASSTGPSGRSWPPSTTRTSPASSTAASRRAGAPTW